MESNSPPRDASVVRQNAADEERDIIIAYLKDRQEQYSPSSGIYEAIYQLWSKLEENAHREAHKHGELDDLVGVRGAPQSKTRAEAARAAAIYVHGHAGWLESLEQHGWRLLHVDEVARLDAAEAYAEAKRIIGGQRCRDTFLAWLRLRTGVV